MRYLGKQSEIDKGASRIFFHNLYKNNYKKMVNFAYRYVYDYSEAENIVQDAFCTLWLDYNKRNIEKSPESYLFGIIRNNCASYLRKLKIKDSNKDKIVEALLFSNIEDVEIEENVKVRLNKILAELPEKQLQVLTQHAIERKNIRTISEEMNISETTVKTHYSRALKYLRKNLLFILIGI